LIEAHRGILGQFVGVAFHPVERRAQFAREAARPSLISAAHHVAHLKAFVVRITVDDERGVLAAKKVRPAAARHLRHRHVRGIPVAHTSMIRHRRAERRMERDESATGDGRQAWGAPVIM
jgi:hypothetical protein